MIQICLKSWCVVSPGPSPSLSLSLFPSLVSYFVLSWQSVLMSSASLKQWRILFRSAWSCSAGMVPCSLLPNSTRSCMKIPTGSWTPDGSSVSVHVVKRRWMRLPRLRPSARSSVQVKGLRKGGSIQMSSQFWLVRKSWLYILLFL